MGTPDQLVKLEEAALRQMVEDAPFACVIHVDGLVVYANQAAETMFGVRPDQVPGASIIEAVAEPDRPMVAARVARVLAGEQVEPAEARMRRLDDGHPFRVESVAMPITVDNRRGVYTVLWDVTDRVAARERWTEKALHDSLTGLANRALLAERLDHAVNRVQQGARAELVLIDLDGFKNVNDTHGHTAGDAVLREVADRLHTAVRGVDTVARLGGDEFVLLCENIGPDDVAALLTRLRQALTEPFLWNGEQLNVGASLGHISIGPDATPEQVLAAADARMYENKESRRPHLA